MNHSIDPDTQLYEDCISLLKTLHPPSLPTKQSSDFTYINKLPQPSIFKQTSLQTLVAFAVVGAVDCVQCQEVPSQEDIGKLQWVSAPPLEGV